MKPLNKNSKQKIMIGIAVLMLIAIGLSYVFIKQSTPASYKKLVIGRSNDAISLDPAITTDAESFEVAVNIYETLVKTDKESQTILPGLAESWKMSENGLKWTFRIRDNVTFHDGSELNAKAVAFNFHRWMNEDSPYHTGRFTYWSHSFNGFPGIVRSVTALSDMTLEIVLNEPYAPFLSVVSMTAFGIASPDAIMTYNENLKRHPVGTGPFVFSEWIDGKTILLEKNTRYWDSKAKVDAIEFRTIHPDEDKLKLLASGEIHIATSLSPQEVVLIEQIETLDLYYRPFLNIGYLALNNRIEPYDKIEVREAIGLLIDKNKMMDKELDALSRPAHSFLPPLILGYHEGIKSIEYNLEKAKDLLVQAGYPDGFDTIIWVMDGQRNYFSNPRAMASYIQAQLAPAGINVEVKVFKWDAYIERIKEGDHEMALVGWNGDFVDPDNFLYTLFSSENTKEGLVLNYSFYKNERVDFLLTQARRSTDIEFRKSLYRELQEIIEAEIASIPLVHTMTAIATSKSVIGFNTQITGVEELKDVDLIIEE